MKKIKKAGTLLALMGMGVFAVALFNDSALWAQTLRDGGIVLFSVGMAGFLSAISYSLGMDTERVAAGKSRFFKTRREHSAPSSLLVYSSSEEDNSSSVK